MSVLNATNVAVSTHDIQNVECSGWTKSLEKMPQFTHGKLEHKLLRNSETMPDKVSPKAHRNIYLLYR